MECVVGRKYFRAVCEVDEPEVKFNMDQYADVTRVTKPVIYISIAEIIETHKVYKLSIVLLYSLYCVCGVSRQRKDICCKLYIEWLYIVVATGAPGCYRSWP